MSEPVDIDKADQYRPSLCLFGLNILFFLILVFLDMEGSGKQTAYFDYKNNCCYSISQANQAHIRQKKKLRLEQSTNLYISLFLARKQYFTMNGKLQFFRLFLQPTLTECT